MLKYFKTNINVMNIAMENIKKTPTTTLKDKRDNI